MVLDRICPVRVVLWTDFWTCGDKVFDVAVAPDSGHMGGVHNRIGKPDDGNNK